MSFSIDPLAASQSHASKPQLHLGFDFFLLRRMTVTCRSLWISDTACAALMAPIAYALLEAVMIHKMKSPAVNGDVTVLQVHGDVEKRWGHRSYRELDAIKLQAAARFIKNR